MFFEELEFYRAFGTELACLGNGTVAFLGGRNWFFLGAELNRVFARN